MVKFNNSEIDKIEEELISTRFIGIFIEIFNDIYLDF